MVIVRISQTFCGSGRNWSNFLQEWAGLVKLSVGMGETGQIKETVLLTALPQGIA